MATATLLTSADFVRAHTSISDNVDGKYITPAIREAQDIHLRGILGDCLLERLKDLVGDDRIKEPEYADYKDLADRSQYYLAYVTVARLIPVTTWKVGNFGLAKSSDENLTVATDAEMDRQVQYWNDLADSYAGDLQRWILAHASAFPELDACGCDAIRANLRSMSSCGIFLGGPRGKMIGRAGK